MSRSIKTLLDTFDAAKAELAKATQEDMHGLFAPLFEKHPELQSFSWVQFTPHFNDGDPCSFNSHDITRVNGFSEDGDYEDEVDDPRTWSSEVESGYGKDRKRGPLGAAYDAAQALKNSIDDDVLETLLGEGRVTVTKTGIEVEEYDHD